MTKQSRFRGCLLGLAIGDALGTTLEFKSPGTFDPIDDMVGGGPFGLKAGEWTDDTSLALCLAESLIERDGFDPIDQLARYVKWWQDGYMTADGGACFDIGNTTKQALSNFLRTHKIGGCDGTYSAGNGSIMRLAPIPMFYAGNAQDVIHYSGESSKTTHANDTAVHGCQYLGILIAAALTGGAKDDILADHERLPFVQDIVKIASGSFKRKEPPEIRATGYVVDTLESALWAFYKTDNFRDGALKAVNLGDDADTVGAVYGQVAGAFYGEEGIPVEWRHKVAKRDLIIEFADRLAGFL